MKCCVNKFEIVTQLLLTNPIITKIHKSNTKNALEYKAQKNPHTFESFNCSLKKYISFNVSFKEI